MDIMDFAEVYQYANDRIRFMGENLTIYPRKDNGGSITFACHCNHGSVRYASNLDIPLHSFYKGGVDMVKNMLLEWIKTMNKELGVMEQGRSQNMGGKAFDYMFHQNPRIDFSQTIKRIKDRMPRHHDCRGGIKADMAFVDDIQHVDKTMVDIINKHVQSPLIGTPRREPRPIQDKYFKDSISKDVIKTD